MRGSREIAAGVLIIGAVLLAYFFFFRSAPETPLSHSDGQAGFITTSKPDSTMPASPAQEPRPEIRSKTESAVLPPVSNARLRRSADERFPARLDVVVLDAKTHLPIPGARVRAINRATQETVAEQVLLEGRGTLDLPNGAFRLTFGHQDYQERGLWIEFNSSAGQVSRQTIELMREVQVSGTVRDQNGTPVSGARLVFPATPRHREPEIETGADGKFNCRLPAGAINGAVIKGENRATFASQLTETGPNVLDITLPITSATISFTGRVLNQKGEPIEGALVRIMRTTSRRRDSGYAQSTGEDGTFALTLPPVPDGLVAITAAGARQRVERVPLTADIQRDFVLDSQPAFTVTLLTPEGEALTKGFRVESVGPSAPKITRLPDGQFCAAEYPVEIRAVAAESGYGNSEIVRLSAYEPEVTLRIEPGGNLSGRAVDPSGRAITRFSYLLLQGHNLYLAQSFIDSPDGSFAVRHVAPGSYTINIVADGFRMQGREIEVEAGKDYFVEMILQPEPRQHGPRLSRPD